MNGRTGGQEADRPKDEWKDRQLERTGRTDGRTDGTRDRVKSVHKEIFAYTQRSSSLQVHKNIYTHVFGGEVKSCNEVVRKLECDGNNYSKCSVTDRQTASLLFYRSANQTVFRTSDLENAGNLLASNQYKEESLLVITSELKRNRKNVVCTENVHPQYIINEYTHCLSDLILYKLWAIYTQNKFIINTLHVIRKKTLPTCFVYCRYNLQRYQH